MFKIGKTFAGVLLLSALLAQTAWAGPESFVMHNTTGVDIHAVYIGSSDEAEWGENMLDEGEVVVDGDDIEIEFAPGEDRESWDLRLEDSAGNSLNFMEVDLLGAGTVILKEDNTAVIK